jgi:hypothetical protein
LHVFGTWKGFPDPDARRVAAIGTVGEGGQPVKRSFFHEIFFAAQRKSGCPSFWHDEKNSTTPDGICLYGGEAAFDKSAKRFNCSARDEGDHSLCGAVLFTFSIVAAKIIPFAEAKIPKVERLEPQRNPTA